VRAFNDISGLESIIEYLAPVRMFFLGLCRRCTVASCIGCFHACCFAINSLRAQINFLQKSIIDCPTLDKQCDFPFGILLAIRPEIRICRKAVDHDRLPNSREPKHEVGTAVQGRTKTENFIHWHSVMYIYSFILGSVHNRCASG